jgi:hypothetical protein
MVTSIERWSRGLHVDREEGRAGLTIYIRPDNASILASPIVNLFPYRGLPFCVSGLAVLHGNRHPFRPRAPPHDVAGLPHPAIVVPGLTSSRPAGMKFS